MNELSAELEILRKDLRRCAETAADALKSGADSASENASAEFERILADIKAHLDGAQSQAEQLVTDQPVAAVASAFLAGVAVGRDDGKMRLDSIFPNLRVLWRADRIIADIRLRHLLLRSGLNAAALLIAVLGLLFLEIAAYFAIVQKVSAIGAAALLGTGNLLLSGVLMLVAARKKPDREIELVRDVHRNAVEALQLDMQVLQEQFGRATRFEAMVPALIPLASLLLRSLKKSKTPPKA